eukprot:scaffold44165_cov57-Phaeocystis_antarctica.AAC.5
MALAVRVGCPEEAASSRLAEPVRVGQAAAAAARRVAPAAPVAAAGWVALAPSSEVPEAAVQAEPAAAVPASARRYRSTPRSSVAAPAACAHVHVALQVAVLEGARVAVEAHRARRRRLACRGVGRREPTSHLTATRPSSRRVVRHAVARGAIKAIPRGLVQRRGSRHRLRRLRVASVLGQRNCRVLIAPSIIERSDVIQGLRAAGVTERLGQHGWRPRRRRWRWRWRRWDRRRQRRWGGQGEQKPQRIGEDGRDFRVVPTCVTKQAASMQGSKRLQSRDGGGVGGHLLRA